MNAMWAMVRMVAVGAALGLMPVSAWGQGALVAPVDEATLARATARGKELVKGARWAYPEATRLLAVGGGRVFVAKGEGTSGRKRRMARLWCWMR